VDTWTVVWHGPHDEPPGKANRATAVCLTDCDEFVIDVAARDEVALAGIDVTAR
jgi:hypothetical protein